MLRGMGLDVDDDNEPSPENVPVDPSLPTVTSDKNYVYEGLGWGWSGIDHRKTLNVHDTKPSLKGIIGDAVHHLSFVGMFFLLFPRRFIQEVIIFKTNKN